MLAPTMLVGGRVVGTWRRALRGPSVTLTMRPFAPLSVTDTKALARVADGYGEFLGKTVSIVTHRPH
jgi:hypothetical protein